MGFEGSGHKSSKSFPDNDGVEDSKLEDSQHLKIDMKNLKDLKDSVETETEKNRSPRSRVQDSLRQEIQQLEKRLQGQVAIRGALEMAQGYNSSSHDVNNEILISKPATKLIREIAVLEVEVVQLEHHLLSLYRKAFDQQPSSSLSSSSKDERSNSQSTTPRGRCLRACQSDVQSKRETLNFRGGCHSMPRQMKDSDSGGEREAVDSGVQRCHSSLPQRPVLSTETSRDEILGNAVRACRSQPPSMMEYAQNAAPNVVSLAELLGARISDHVPETPNKLSEDMIKCISSIYYKLGDLPSTNHVLSSPSSSLSSASAFSPKDQCEMWSPGFRRDSSFDVRLDNPFHVEGLKEFSGPYSTMIEVPCIYKDSQSLADIEPLLLKFRSLICRLEEVDPRKLKHEEKLAFWINVHNALVMHAFLANGIPQNNMKRTYLLLKAAYNIGGRIVSVNTIQNCILGCSMSLPGQWLRFLLVSRTKFKTGDKRQAYAIEHPEPLLHFALCSGNHSDPAVRVYTPKRLFQDLEVAKEEYIRATYGVRKDHRILLPKIVESFAKDAALCPAGVVEMIQQCLPQPVRRTIKKCRAASGKSRKVFEWVPYNFTFRYLISKELVK